MNEQTTGSLFGHDLVACFNASFCLLAILAAEQTKQFACNCECKYCNLYANLNGLVINNNGIRKIVIKIHL